jgi:hypothetical protein
VTYWPYIVAAVLIVAAFLVGSLRRGNSVRARDISGISIGGNASGSVSQNAPPPRATANAPTVAATKPDRVAWTIAIIGVLVAAAALAHDLIAGK